MLADQSLHPHSRLPKNASSRPKPRSGAGERPAFWSPLLLGMILLSASAPAHTPAGADAPLPAPARTTRTTPDIPAKQLREAEDAFLKGARALDHKDLAEAETNFARAAKLNPY